MAKANPDSLFSLAGRMANRMNSNGVSQERAEFIKGDEQFWTRFDALVLNIDPGIVKDLESRVAARDMNTEAQIADWEKFYSEFFSLDIGFDPATVPQRQSGFDRLILIPRGLRINIAYAACKKHFKCWKWMDGDIESEMQESEQGPAKQVTARWFRERIEADEEMQNKSAVDLENEKIQGITLLERIVYELKYWSETEKHLDVKNVTLCSGSRYRDGDVPSADWRSDGDGFRVGWDNSDYRFLCLRSRVAVG